VTPSRTSPTAVLLPGTGSDDVFVREVFQRPLAAVGVSLIAPAPVPGSALADAHLAALSAAAREAPVLVGGISFGAHLAAEWAIHNQERCAGLLLALPAWHGRPDGSPASIAARYSAQAVRAHGVDLALSQATAGVAPWLADELSRAWRGYGDGLVGSLACAAGRPAPEMAALARLTVPAGVAGFEDDPVHPLEVARTWAAALGTAVLGTTTLRALADDRQSLGRATVLAWLRAGGRPRA
jgi:pimeloyl-ACP methyl ester carboxylesterase